MTLFQMLDRVDKALRTRIERVATEAARAGDTAIVEWAVRATDDALALGRLRDRDREKLNRLEDTYGHEFYNANGGTTFIHA